MLIHYHTLRHMDDIALVATIRSVQPSPLSQVRLFDLLADGDQLLPLGHGVYIVSSPTNGPSTQPFVQDEFLYVGECKRRNFAERISSHLAFGQYGRLATLKLKLMSSGFFANNNEALFFVGQCGLRLIDFGSYDLLNAECSSFETRLRMVLTPCLNPIRSQRSAERRSPAKRAGLQ